MTKIYLKSLTNHFYNIRAQGLGIIITQLSFLMAMHKKIVAVAPESSNIIHDLKRIFLISDDRLTIELGTHGHPDLATDELCTYAPYYCPDTIQVLGQTFSTARKKKPCVALTMHHPGGYGNSKIGFNMPNNKFATPEEYEQVFSMLTQMGYDVITMNQNSVNLEQKVYLLNQLCDAVIGYEGGVGHLAHMLQIPYIVFPWRLDHFGQPELEKDVLWYETQRFQPDRRTWFLKNVEELLSWTRADLLNMIDCLYNLGGNNILFDPDTVMNPETYQIFAKNGMDLTPRIMWCETRGAYTSALIREQLPLEYMVKYPLKSITYRS